VPALRDLPLRHRIGGLAFALAVGVVLAWLAYQLAVTPLPREERVQQEAMVLEARRAIVAHLGDAEPLEIVDPLQPNRVAGKVFIYPVADGWQVSGFYRSGGRGAWQPWLVTLDADGEIMSIAAAGDEDSDTP